MRREGVHGDDDVNCLVLKLVVACRCESGPGALPAQLDRQPAINAELHRFAMHQAHWHPAAKGLMTRRKNRRDSGVEALRVLNRTLSDLVCAALITDLANGRIPLGD